MTHISMSLSMLKTNNQIKDNVVVFATIIHEKRGEYVYNVMA